MSVETFTGLRMNQFERLFKVVRERGGDGPRIGRPWCLPPADRVLMVAVYHRPNPTMRQLAQLFGGGQGRSAALVFADRTTAVQAKVADHYPKVGKVRRTRFTGSGYRQGHADGQQADIGGLTVEYEREQPDELMA